MPASRQPSGSSTQVWLTRTVNAMSCPRQVERLRQAVRRTETQERQGLFRLNTLIENQRGCRTFGRRHSFE